MSRNETKSGSSGESAGVSSFPTSKNDACPPLEESWSFKCNQVREGLKSAIKSATKSSGLSHGRYSSHPYTSAYTYLVTLKRLALSSSTGQMPDSIQSAISSTHRFARGAVFKSLGCCALGGGGVTEMGVGEVHG